MIIRKRVRSADEERKEVKKVVGEALEENFTELEVLSTKKAESEEPVSAEQGQLVADIFIVHVFNLKDS